MKMIASVLLFLAALALLFTPRARAQAQDTTRFTMTVEGKAGGPEILLLPGLTSGREVFDKEAALLSPGNRLYRFQLNGFDGQPAGPNAQGPILVPVVEELHSYIVAHHLHPFVIGHSMGGLLGLMLAQAHPEDVRKLMVVDALPFYALVFAPEATVAMVMPQAKQMRDGIIAATPVQRAGMAGKTASMLVNDPAGQKLVEANSLASDRTVMADAMYEDLTTDLRAQLPAIKTTTVLLYPYDAAVAGPDPSRVDSLYKSAYTAMPNVTLHRIDASRHFIQLDQPTAFDAQVQLFLKS